MILTDAPYSAAHDAGIIWNDPDLGIEWPAEANPACLSPKAKVLPRLRDIETPF